MEVVCKELDRVLVEMMDCLEQLAVLRRRLSDTVSEGYINMAKARYSMGPLSVNPLQYDTVMSASCLAEVGGAEGKGAGSTGHTVFTISHNPSQRNDGGCEVDNQLRRRRRPQTGEPEPGGGGGEEEEEEGEDGGHRNQRPPKNPINWFGVLVPQSLRQSQQNFKRATVVCGELATLQSKLESLRVQYGTLHHRKHQLLKSASRFA